MLGMIRTNPVRLLIMASAISGLLFVGFLLWRIHYLSDKVSNQKSLITGYERTITHLREAAEISEAVTIEDATRYRIDEDMRLEAVGDIRDEEIKHSCSPVVANTVNGLFK